MKKYPDLGPRFKPLVLESTGGWHKLSFNYLRTLANHIVSRTKSTNKLASEALPLFLPFFTRMTKIDGRLQLQINALSDAGVKPMAISRQLGLKYDTVKKNVAKRKLTDVLPPKDKLFKGKINGRWPLKIKKYLTQEHTATLEGIIAAACFSRDTTSIFEENGLAKKGSEATDTII
jgi:hypothetical protein